MTLIRLILLPCYWIPHLKMGVWIDLSSHLKTYVTVPALIFARNFRFSPQIFFSCKRETLSWHLCKHYQVEFRMILSPHFQQRFPTMMNPLIKEVGGTLYKNRLNWCCYFNLKNYSPAWGSRLILAFKIWIVFSLFGMCLFKMPGA